MTTTQTDRVRDLIADEVDDLITIRRDLHAHPELGYEEFRTSGLVQGELADAAIEFVAGLAGGTGVLGHLPGPSGGAIGLRADMDALPITEVTDLQYKSTNEGAMHACGHDGHTAILIGAARVLAKLAAESGLPRPVSFVFQPAEEGGAGGRRMIEDGCLDGSRLGPPIENMFGLHGWPQMPLGVVGTRPGPLLAAADTFEIEVTGVGSHAAFPHLGADPIVAGAAIVNAVQSIISRNTDPLDAAVLSVTQFHSGTTHNIIPESARIEGTVRTLTDDVQERTKSRMKEVAERIASAHECTASFTYRYGYPVTRNDPGAVDIFEATATKALGPERIVHIPTPFMGAEDFSFYCEKVPSCFFVVGLLPPGQESMPQLHQPTFNFEDIAIATGVELFCRLALRE